MILSESRAIWAVERLRRAEVVDGAGRDAALRTLAPRRWQRDLQRIMLGLAALCLAFTLFSLAAYNFTALMAFLMDQVYWFLRLSSLVHVGLASLPMIIFGGLLMWQARRSTANVSDQRPSFLHSILSVLTMGTVGLPVIVAGQIYQVGANSSGLFLVWGLLSLPIVLAARTTVAWFASLVLFSLFAVFLTLEQFLPTVTPALVPLAGLGLWFAMRRWGPAWVDGVWFPSVMLLGVFGFMLAALGYSLTDCLIFSGIQSALYLAIFVLQGPRKVVGAIAYALIIILVPLLVGRLVVKSFFLLGAGFIAISAMVAVGILIWFTLAITVFLRLRVRGRRHD